MHVLSSKTEPTKIRRRRGRIIALVVVSLVGMVVPVSAQAGCSQPGKNIQCNEMGAVMMDTQRDIRGDPVSLSAEIWLNTDFADQGARWFLFSVRNTTSDGPSPVTISVDRFGTDTGDIATTRVEHNTPNEINFWVDGLDLPVGTPIHLDLTVGCTERGAFRLETLVMAFDRGYAPIADSSGAEASLFSFTLLGVNKETSAINVDGGGIVDGKKLPGLALPILGISLLAAVVLVRRRTDDA